VAPGRVPVVEVDASTRASAVCQPHCGHFKPVDAELLRRVIRA
jgi:hypothetical protein